MHAVTPAIKKKTISALKAYVYGLTLFFLAGSK